MMKRRKRVSECLFVFRAPGHTPVYVTPQYFKFELRRLKREDCGLSRSAAAALGRDLIDSLTDALPGESEVVEDRCVLIKRRGLFGVRIIELRIITLYVVESPDTRFSRFLQPLSQHPLAAELQPSRSRAEASAELQTA